MDIGQARAILDLAHSAFVSMDEDGRIVYWNIRAEEIFGFTRGEAVGRVLADTVIPERLRASHWEGLRRFLETGEGAVLNKRLEMSALRADGSEFPAARSCERTASVSISMRRPKRCSGRMS